MNAREGNSRHGWIAYGYIQGYMLQSHTREGSSRHRWIAYGYIQDVYIVKSHTREGSSRMGGLPMDIHRRYILKGKHLSRIVGRSIGQDDPHASELGIGKQDKHAR